MVFNNLQLTATDNDSDKRIEYRLLSVSNNGIRKFAVEPATGRVNVIGPVRPGEHFSLTVAAIDSGGKTTQAVMEGRADYRDYLGPFDTKVDPMTATLR